MTLRDRIQCLVFTGKAIHAVVKNENNLSFAQEKLKTAIEKVCHHNTWFSPWSVNNSLIGISQMLNEDDIIEWIALYHEKLSTKSNSNRIGIIMAGNIPLVGFHDLICVFLSGDRSVIKMSSEDNILLPIVLEMMSEFSTEVNSLITISNSPLKEIDKIIATGSNNSSRYFEYYFGKYPHIIRKNRTSVAVLSGNESELEIKNLAKDIFFYYGLGCRNVSKIFIPENYELPSLIDLFQDFVSNMDNVKYNNNLDYHKSVYLINNFKFLDGGFFLMLESSELHSPVSVIYFEYYKSLDELKVNLENQKNEIQCIVSHIPALSAISFGQAQNPKLWDYADDVDTMEFLL